MTNVYDYLCFVSQEAKETRSSKSTNCGGTHSSTLVFYSSSAGLCIDNTRQLMGWPKMVNRLWKKKQIYTLMTYEVCLYGLGMFNNCVAFKS